MDPATVGAPIAIHPRVARVGPPEGLAIDAHHCESDRRRRRVRPVRRCQRMLGRFDQKRIEHFCPRHCIDKGRCNFARREIAIAHPVADRSNTQVREHRHRSTVVPAKAGIS